MTAWVKTSSRVKFSDSKFLTELVNRALCNTWSFTAVHQMVDFCDYKYVMLSCLQWILVSFSAILKNQSDMGDPVVYTYTNPHAEVRNFTIRCRCSNLVKNIYLGFYMPSSKTKILFWQIHTYMKRNFHALNLAFLGTKIRFLTNQMKV